MEKRDFLFRFIPQTIRSKLHLDEEALYSTTDQLTADKITKDIRTILSNQSVVTDATACIGGSAYSLSRAFSKVHAVEVDQGRYRFLSHNMQLLGASNVECIHGNAIEVCKKLTQDLIFLDPPWGGPEYKSKAKVTLQLDGKDISEVCKDLSPHTRYIAMKVPTNFNEEDFLEQTKEVLWPVHRNTQLRKMNLLIYESRKRQQQTR